MIEAIETKAKRFRNILLYKDQESQLPAQILGRALIKSHHCFGFGTTMI